MHESASAIVFDKARTRVLLVKREDFRVWALPGGGIEASETHEQAAVREMCEETGYEIAIDRLVGRYSHPQAPRGGDLRYLFEGHIVGGSAITNGPETASVGFFPIDALPPRTTPWVKGFIADALANLPSVVERIQYLPLWMVIAIRIGLGVRDLRNWYFLKHR